MSPTASRMLASLLIGVLISAGFWFARDLGSVGYNAMIYANLPAVVAGTLASGNVHQPSAIAVFATMVIQWTLAAYAVLWLVARRRRLEQ